MPVSTESIVDLEEQVQSLSRRDRSLFQRLYQVTTTVGHLDPPAEMRDWIRSYFGSLEATTAQKIVKVTNLVTLESALFNDLRARRPIETKDSGGLQAQIEQSVGDPLCHPETGTPADTFGRIRGKYCSTAANIAKFDGLHCLIVFDEHNPIDLQPERVVDSIETALRWAHEARRTDPEAKYFFFLWNCLWRAGASLLHGHAQATLGRGMHYAKIEALRRAALSYRDQYGSSYFDDLYMVHHVLGCGFEKAGVRILASLTPLKEKECLLLADASGPGTIDASLLWRIGEALSSFRQRLGVESFNLALYLPPLAEVEEDWSGFPAMARLVDRGSPEAITSDFGAMELYAATVVSSDPFAVARALKESLL